MEKLIPFIIAIIVWVLLYKYVRKTRSKVVSHSLSLLASIIALLLTIIVISPSKEDYSNYKVLSVSDYDYTLKNKPAVGIFVGETKDNYVDITINKENVKENFEVNTKNNSSDKNLIGVTAHWDSITYFLNSKNHNSFVNLKITKIDREKKEAQFFINAKLYPQDDNTPKFINTEFTIEGENFNNLVK